MNKKINKNSDHNREFLFLTNIENKKYTKIELSKIKEDTI